MTQKIVRWFQRYKKWSIENKIYPPEMLSDVLSETRESGDIVWGPANEDDYLKESGGYGYRVFPKLRLGNISSFRDWSHASDIVDAVDLMLRADKPDDYVVGSGETRTVREFLAVVCKEILNDDDFMKYVVIDPEFFRPAEVEYLRADASKIKSKLGWEPKINFNQLVKDMCCDR